MVYRVYNLGHPVGQSAEEMRACSPMNTSPAILDTVRGQASTI